MHIAHLDRFGSVGRCAIFGFVFLGQKNHKMHIAHLDDERRAVHALDRRGVGTEQPSATSALFFDIAK
jgi:hypothetical protein